MGIHRRGNGVSESVFRLLHERRQQSVLATYSNVNHSGAALPALSGPNQIVIISDFIK